MLYDATSTVAFDRAVPDPGDPGALADVELPQAAHVIGQRLETGVSDPLASAEGQLLQIRASGGEGLEGCVADVALAYVEGAHTRATARQGDGRAVAERLATAGVQVAQLVAVTGDDQQAGVGHAVAFAYGEVAEGRTETRGQLAHPEVRNFHAIRHRQLTQAGAIGGDGDQAGVSDAAAPTQVEASQVRHARQAQHQAGVFDPVAIAEIERLQLQNGGAAAGARDAGTTGQVEFSEVGAAVQHGGDVGVGDATRVSQHQGGQIEVRQLGEDAGQSGGAFQDQTTDARVAAAARQGVQRRGGVLRITHLDLPPEHRMPRDLPEASTSLRQRAAVASVEPAENPQQQIIIKLAEVVDCDMVDQMLGLR